MSEYLLEHIRSEITNNQKSLHNLGDFLQQQWRDFKKTTVFSVKDNTIQSKIASMQKNADENIEKIGKEIDDFVQQFESVFGDIQNRFNDSIEEPTNVSVLEFQSKYFQLTNQSDTPMGVHINEMYQAIKKRSTREVDQKVKAEIEDEIKKFQDNLKDKIGLLVLEQSQLISSSYSDRLKLMTQIVIDSDPELQKWCKYDLTTLANLAEYSV